MKRFETPSLLATTSTAALAHPQMRLPNWTLSCSAGQLPQVRLPLATSTAPQATPQPCRRCGWVQLGAAGRSWVELGTGAIVRPAGSGSEALLGTMQNGSWGPLTDGSIQQRALAAGMVGGRRQGEEAAGEVQVGRGRCVVHAAAASSVADLQQQRGRGWAGGTCGWAGAGRDGEWVAGGQAWGLVEGQGRSRGEPSQQQQRRLRWRQR